MALARQLSISISDSRSEYGEEPGEAGRPLKTLSISDHELIPEGIQARRTAGEAQIEWERRHLREIQGSTGCISIERALWRSPAAEPRRVVLAWAEVDSVCLLSSRGRVPQHLIVVSALRQRDGTRRDVLLQAGSARELAHWGLAVAVAVARERIAAPVTGGTTGRAGALPLALSMDLARIGCRAAQLWPSPKGLKQLISVMDLLVTAHASAQSVVAAAGPTQPPFPLMALERFCEAARQALVDFEEWRRWREAALLVRPPHGIDSVTWVGHVVPFLSPEGASMRNPRSNEYPLEVEKQLAVAARRCRRALP